MATKVCLKIIRKTERVFFNQKEKKLKSFSTSHQKKELSKSKIKEIIKIPHNSKIKRDRKIEEIEKILYELKEEDYYKPIKINNVFNDYISEYQSNGDKDKTLSVKEYLHVIRQYLSDIVNNHKTQNEWKIKLSLAIDFVSSEDFKKSSHHVYTWQLIGSETDEITENFLNLF